MRFPLVTQWSGLAAAAVGLTACHRPGPNAEAVAATVEDSAGVRIVSSVGPRHKSAIYQVDARPVVEFRAAAEYAGRVLATCLRNGRVVAADLGANHLALFRSDGSQLATLGNPGDGPGEYRRINYVGALPGDSIVVSDPINWRLTILDGDGKVVRTARLPDAGPGATLAVAGVFGDGRLLATSFFPANDTVRPGPVRNRHPFAVLTSAGTRVSTLGSFPGPEGFIVMTSEADGIPLRLPFGRVTRHAELDSTLVIGTNDAAEVGLFDLRGRRLASFRWQAPVVAVTPIDIQEVVASAIPQALDSTARHRLARALGAAPIPKRRPPYDRILARSNGELWVREFMEPDQRRRPSRWTVIDASGSWLTTVQIPTGLEPQWIGTDSLLASWQDDLDIDHLGMFRLAARAP